MNKQENKIIEFLDSPKELERLYRSKPEQFQELTDAINVALVSVTLVINAIVLSAIIFRLSEYGITPNRVVVTGENLLIFVHLVLILREYIKYIKFHADLGPLHQSVASYLSIYSAWSLFVAVALPLLFSFK